MTWLMGPSTGVSPVMAFGAADHPDPVAAAPMQVPGARAGYLPQLWLAMAGAMGALRHRQRLKKLRRELAERPDHVLIDAGIPLELVRGVQSDADPLLALNQSAGR